MVYATAFVSFCLLTGSLAVIAAMIAPNFARIRQALEGASVAPRSARSFARRRGVGAPRVIAVRPLMRAAA